MEKEADKLDIEVAFLYVDDVRVTEMSFANNIYTPEGGMHLTGFRSALTRTLNNYARAEGWLKEKEENLTADDVREGLVAVISVKLRDPQFEGQTKAKLGNPEARTATESVVNEALKEFLEKHPAGGKAIIQKVILTAKARLAAKAARETVLRKGAFEGLTLPGKLADCTSKIAAESELFIVEGDSAGGTAKQGRNRHTQAILAIARQAVERGARAARQDARERGSPLARHRDRHRHRRGVQHGKVALSQDHHHDRCRR